MVDSKTNVERWEEIGKNLQGLGCAIIVFLISLILLVVIGASLLTYLAHLFGFGD